MSERQGAMIARMWRGAVGAQDADAYASYMQRTGVRGYAETPGNRAVYMLRRDLGELCEFVMVTLWDSLHAVKAFAGEDYEAAVFYPEDDRFLVERDQGSRHFQVPVALPEPRRRGSPAAVIAGPAGIRRAEPADAVRIGELLHDFNAEFEEQTPRPRALAERVRRLLEEDEITVLLAGREAAGLAVLRFRPALTTDALDCYVEELYVVPERREQGLGRALMEAAMELARREGATHMDLGTGEDDVAARALYERLGFRAAGMRRRYYHDNGEDAVIMWRTPATLAGSLDDVPDAGPVPSR